ALPVNTLPQGWGTEHLRVVRGTRAYFRRVSSNHHWVQNFVASERGRIRIPSGSRIISKGLLRFALRLSSRSVPRWLIGPAAGRRSSSHRGLSSPEGPFGHSMARPPSAAAWTRASFAVP